MDKYRSAGGSVLTPYFYNGTQLELPALLLAMEDIHTRFRDHINAWTAGRIEGALSFHDHMEGLQLLDRIGRDYMRMFISYYGLPFPESNCGRCGAYPGTMGAKHGVKNEGILIDCPTKMEPCAFCKVVFSCVPDVGVKMLEGNSELHPTGCHSKDVCPYMRSNYPALYGVHCAQDCGHPVHLQAVQSSWWHVTGSDGCIPEPRSFLTLLEVSEIIGVGTNEVYKINKYDIYSQGWYLPVSKRMTKALKKRKKYRENITKELDMIKQHMQCTQEASGEICATQEPSGTLGATQNHLRRFAPFKNHLMTRAAIRLSRWKTQQGLAQQIHGLFLTIRVS